MRRVWSTLGVRGMPSKPKAKAKLTGLARVKAAASRSHPSSSEPSLLASAAGGAGIVAERGKKKLAEELEKAHRWMRGR